MSGGLVAPTSPWGARSLVGALGSPGRALLGGALQVPPRSSQARGALVLLPRHGTRGPMGRPYSASKKFLQVSFAYDMEANSHIIDIYDIYIYIYMIFRACGNIAL